MLKELLIRFNMSDVIFGGSDRDSFVLNPIKFSFDFDSNSFKMDVKKDQYPLLLKALPSLNLYFKEVFIQKNINALMDFESVTLTGEF